MMQCDAVASIQYEDSLSSDNMKCFVFFVSKRLFVCYCCKTCKTIFDSFLKGNILFLLAIFLLNDVENQNFWMIVSSL